MKSIINPEYTDLQVNPSLSEWAALLPDCALEHEQLKVIRDSARRRLVERAEQFVLRLSGLADEADLPAHTQPLLTGNPATQPIVMTGHQPVVFHSGLTFKYEVSQKFAAEQNAIAAAVIIDTDQGDPGQFSYPVIPMESSSGSAVSLFSGILEIESIASSPGLYGHGRLKSSEELQKISDLVTAQLMAVEQPLAAKFAGDALRQFSQLSAVRASAMEANVIMRWQRNIGGRMLELPLSAIASFPESLVLTADILKQARRFADAYNAALDVFRDEHGIRNAANPFPNLKTTRDTCELPFWVISHEHKTRHALEVQLDGNVTRLLANGRVMDSFAGNITPEALEPMLLQSIQLVPRGALITAFLRLLFCDLFVHGTGGGRYDRFTDEFIRSWWNVEPPSFTVASASRYRFPEKQAELRRMEHIQSELRDLQYNPQRHFDRGVFSSQLQQSLSKLCEQRHQMVESMKVAHASGQSARQSGMEIQQLTNRIRDEVTREFEPQLQRLNLLTLEQRDAMNCRTYPWFMFC